MCDLKIISPEDTEEVLIQKGRDLVTLLTCHPYTKNYQRYLVVAERSDEEPQTEEEDLAEAGITYDESPRQVEGENGETVLVDPSDVSPSVLEGAEASGAGYSNLQIWLENYGIWIAFAVMVIVVVTAVLIRGRRQNAGRTDHAGRTDRAERTNRAGTAKNAERTMLMEKRKNRRRRKRR